MINNKKGITIVGLGIVIVVIMILTGIGVTYGVNTVKTAKDKQAYSELYMVQHAVLEQYTKFETTKDTDYLVGNQISLSSAKTLARSYGVILVTIPDSYSNKDYYKLDKTALEKIGITNTEDEFLINYVSGEVLNLTKAATSNGTALYVTANSFN